MPIVPYRRHAYTHPRPTTGALMCALVYFSNAPATLLAPVAHKWTGPACEKPVMLAQIPTAVTNPPTRYICPES